MSNFSYNFIEMYSYVSDWGEVDVVSYFDKSSLRNQAISLINDNQVPIGLVLQTQFILLEHG